MTTRHTPGPWKVYDPEISGHTFGITAADGTAVVWYGSDSEEGIRSNADARLIAAAPELLEALRSYMGAVSLMNAAMEDGANVHGAISGLIGAEDNARDAIAKATGAA